MRRTGFGIALVGRDGSLIAFGYGVPPHWVWDAAGAELWAVYVVASFSVSLPRIITDCKGIVDGLNLVPQATTNHDRALARTWAMLRRAVDDDFELARQRVTWMPSHESVRAIGRAKDSHGRPITSVMWRANRLVDALAKRAASEYRLPTWALRQVDTAAQLVKYQAAKLGVVTHRVNNCRASQILDGGATVTKLLRDSTAERQPRAPGHRRRRQQPSADPAPSLPSGPPPAPLLGERLTAAANQPRTSADARVTAPGLIADDRYAFGGRKRKCSSSVDLAAQVRACKRATLTAQHQLREDLVEQQQVASWVATRHLVPQKGPSAQERLAELRARLKGRESSTFH